MLFNLDQSENLLLSKVLNNIMLHANAFDLIHFKILSIGKELTLSQMTKFRLFQTERVCRRQFLI